MTSLATPREFYFAFGSNMHLQQMATRCPDSVITAISTLRGYRWQINQRGVANVVQSSSPSDKVVGIVFQVSERDIETLDRNEGVSKRLYEKKMLEVELVPLAIDDLTGRSTSIAADFLRDESRVSQDDQEQQQQTSLNYFTPSNNSSSGAPRALESPKIVPALVYLSNKYNTDGNIRAEYVSRMRLAISDAVTLGVSSSYVEQVLLPIVSAKPQEPVQPKKITKLKSAVKSRSTSASTSGDRVIEEEDAGGQRRKHVIGKSGGARRNEYEGRRKSGQRYRDDRSQGGRRSMEDTRREEWMSGQGVRENMSQGARGLMEDMSGEGSGGREERRSMDGANGSQTTWSRWTRWW